MNNEIEVKILEIDPKTIRNILKKNNAKFVKKVFQKNILYTNDYTKANKILVRLRQEKNKNKNICYLTIKSPSKIINHGKVRKEYEMQISSYKDGHEMLTLQGFKIWYFVEVKREYYSLHSCSVEIIKMPKIPYFIEIEGSQKNISKVATVLGYSKKDYFNKNIFKKYSFKFQSLKF